MKCEKCRIENSPQARFCSNCGVSLTGDKEKTCRSCGTQNDPGTEFCSHCGARHSTGAPHPKHTVVHEPTKKQPLKKNKGRKIPTQRVFGSRGYATAALVAVSVIVFIGLLARRNSERNVDEMQVPVVEATLQDPLEESEVLQIAKRFTCTCGKCEYSLDTCKCATAAKERKSIRSMVKEGQSPAQIVAAITKAYGHVKTGNDLTLPTLGTN